MEFALLAQIIASDLRNNLVPRSNRQLQEDLFPSSFDFNPELPCITVPLMFASPYLLFDVKLRLCCFILLDEVVGCLDIVI